MISTKVSICIPTYNGAFFLKKSIESCLQQTYTNFEIIINDDCSLDETVEIAKMYAAVDQRVKVQVNAKNLGLVGNWNATLDLVSGEWIKILFQDDFMESTCIEEMMRAAQAHPNSVVVSKRSYVFEKGSSKKIIDYYTNQVKTLPHKISDVTIHFTPQQIGKLVAEQIGLNFIAEPSLSFFSTSLYRAIGTFDSELVQVCDFEHLLRASAKSGITYINKPLAHFMVHQHSTTSTNITTNNFRIRFFEIPVLINKIRKNNAFHSLWQGINFSGKIKLWLYTKLRAMEANIISKESKPVREQYLVLLEKYSFMRVHFLEKVFLFPIFMYAKSRMKNK